MLNLNKTQAAWAVVPAIVLIAASIGYRAVANATLEKPPTVVAVFSAQAVFDSFVERAQLEAGFEELTARIKSELAERQNEVEAIEAAFKEASDENRDEIAEQYFQASGELEMYKEFADREQSLEKSLMVQSLFRDIKSSIAKIAQANNYDLVLANDSNLIIPTETPFRTTNEMISLHRVYFASGQVDITEQIITQMNLENDTVQSE